VERIGRSGVEFGGVDLRVLFILSCPGYTGLTGALDWSDRCEPFVGFGSGESLGCVGAGQFLTMLDVFWLALCRVLFPCRLCFGVFFFQCLEKSLRLSGTFVVRLL
jgi:hypothetical protein